MEATGTIMGLRKKVRNWLRKGSLASSTIASSRDSTTASGTATAENMNVLCTARRNAVLPMMLVKLSRNTKLPLMGLSTSE